MHKAQFSRSDERMNGLAHSRAGNKMREEVLHIFLFRSHHAIQILAHQRREGLADGKPHAFLNGLRGPAVEDVPVRAFPRLVIHPRNTQARPELLQGMVERGRRNASTERLCQLWLRDRALAMNYLEGIAGELRVFRSRFAFGSPLGIALAHERIEKWEHRGRYEKRVVLVKKIRLVRYLLPQQPDHQIAGVSSARVGIGVLISR